MLNFKTVYQLLDAFKDNADCLNYYQGIRFADGVFCPHCNGTKHYFLKKQFQYRCGTDGCRKSFNVLTKTVFENTKLPLRLWFAAMYLLTTGKKGISSLQLANQIGVTQRTAWFLLHRIREMLTDKQPELLDGVVQVDETNLEGKDINRHESKKKSYAVHSKTFESKTMVGAISDGKVITKHVTDRKKKSLKPFVIGAVKVGSVLVTDEHGAYKDKAIQDLYNHETVNHQEKEYVNHLGFTTNGIENYWSVLKRGIYGIYHQISAKHCQRYLDEFSFRFNSRDWENQQRFIIALARSGRRLTYNSLINR